jgi:hypothetical protein
LNKKGFALIAALMLIVFSSIAVLGITTFIIQRLSQNKAGQIHLKCLYLAQAGINDAIYWFRLRDLTGVGYFTLGAVNVEPGERFILGGTAADRLMVNTSVTRFNPARNTDFIDLTIQNASNSQAITINRMIVSWQKTGTARRLRNIIIAGSSRWTGNLASPADCDITNYTLNTTPAIRNVLLRFGGDMAGTVSISIQFVMTDGSIRSVAVYPASDNYTFTVKSTGKADNSNIYRTVEADYNLRPLTLQAAQIENCHEINTEIVP